MWHWLPGGYSHLWKWWRQENLPQNRSCIGSLFYKITISCNFLLPRLPHYPRPLSWPNKAMQWEDMTNNRCKENKTPYLYPSFWSPEKLNVTANSPRTSIHTVILVSCPRNMNHSFKSQPEHQISWQGFSSVIPDKCQVSISQQAINISTSFPIHYSLTFRHRTSSI